MQHRVIKHISLALARTLQRECGRALEAPVEVAFRYAPELQEKRALSLLHYELIERSDATDREYEVGAGGEQFRAAPLALTARFLVSAWGPPLEDLELLGAAIRAFHDHPLLEAEDDEELTAAYQGRPAVSLRMIGLEEHRVLTDLFRMPLAPSVGYAVDFAIQSERTAPIKRVRERVLDFRVIDG